MTDQERAMERVRKLWENICKDYQHEYWGSNQGRCLECLAAALLNFRKETLEEAAREVCLGCRHNLQLKRLDHLDVHIFKDGSKRACSAQAIRELEE